MIKIKLNGFLNHAVQTFTYFLVKLPNQRSLITKLFTRVVMAFDNNHGARWRFFEKLLDQPIVLEAIELTEIVNEISIYSIQEQRNDYLLKIQEYSNSNKINPITICLPDVIVQKEKHTNPETDVLEFGNGNRMTSDEVSAKVIDLDDLSELQASARTYNSFDWSDTYSRIFKKTSLRTSR